MGKSSYGFELAMTIIFGALCFLCLTKGAFQGALFFLLLTALAVFFTFKSWYNKNNHSKVVDKKKLSMAAQIENIETEVVGFKGERVIRTTVAFNDTFQYISHKTTRHDSFMVYNIGVTPQQREEIIQEAYVAHYEAFQKAKLMP